MTLAIFVSPLGSGAEMSRNAFSSFLSWKSERVKRAADYAQSVQIHGKTAVQVSDLNEEVTDFYILFGDSDVLATELNYKVVEKPLPVGETALSRGVGWQGSGAEMTKVGDFDVKVGDFFGRAGGGIRRFGETKIEATKTAVVLVAENAEIAEAERRGVTPSPSPRAERAGHQETPHGVTTNEEAGSRRDGALLRFLLAGLLSPRMTDDDQQQQVFQLRTRFAPMNFQRLENCVSMNSNDWK